MTQEEKLLWMFKEVHGEMTGSCYAEVRYVEEDYILRAVGVACMKDIYVCWEESTTQLTFSYLTRHLD